ncbi:MULTISPECIES: hypothetical protein [unclassified Clostridium]|uniref:hypothetical protein n=1 Tax=unclassified Clostridium TaxID=2614128 RepID=UPI00207AA6CD|nr:MULTISPECIES: hypothetical protein [unclassified Clostridium]
MLFIIIIILTIISTLLTIPKVKIVDEYKNKAINPIDKEIVQMDNLFDDMWKLADVEKAKNSILQDKSLIRTVIELSFFDKSIFSDIFVHVLITIIFYIILTFQSSWLIIKGVKNDEDKIIMIFLIIILLLAILFGDYFIGILIILIIALVSGVLSLIKG